MASQGQPTRVPPPPPPPPPQDGLDVSTLVLSAIASAVAAYVTSQIWARGALASAALSPVIVALVKEGLRKPTEVVTAVVPTRTGRGRTRETAALPDDLTEQFEGGAPPPYRRPSRGPRPAPSASTRRAATGCAGGWRSSPACWASRSAWSSTPCPTSSPAVRSPAAATARRCSRAHAGTTRAQRPPPRRRPRVRR